MNNSSKKSLKGIPPDDHFRLLVEYSLTGAYLIQDGIFRYVNPTFCAIFGYDAEEVVDKLGPMELTAPEDREFVTHNIQNRIEGTVSELRYSFHGLKKDGRRIFVEVYGSSVKYKKHPAIIGTIIDNTDRVKAEESSREANEKYRRFFNEDIVAHYVTTPEGAVLDCNDTFAYLFGFSSHEEALKSNVVSIFLEPRERDRFVRLIKERKRLERREVEYVRKDGKKVYVLEKAVGEFDSSGNLKSIYGYLIDETNKRQLEAQLFEAQKLEGIGTLVSGIAHDLNNVLSIVLGQASLMVPERATPERMWKSKEAISKAAKRGAQTIKQLLTFAHKVEIIRESVKVNDVIEELVDFLKETLPEKIDFSVELEPKLPSIQADPNQLQQVLINLCVNARDAMSSGGTLKISTARIGRKSIESRFQELESAEYLMIAVSDTGVGIDKEIMGRIFEPFYTTKGSDHGTGLGLSVVYGIMQSHHGFIDVQSEVGHGTKFLLYLPIPVQIIEAVPSEPKKKFERANGETILVVEDEEGVQDFMKATLEGNGYSVLLAGDGVGAVNIFKERHNEISLVIMDMGLPKMNGAQVLPELNMIKHDVKVIFTSGYIEPDIKASIFKAGIKEFLSKPFSDSDLLEKVHMVLMG